MDNLDIYNKYSDVPETARKVIGAGRLKGMTDINPMWRIKALTELFGPCGVGWYIKPVNKWIETVGTETVAFVDLELYVKIDGEWSMPIAGTGGSKLATQESKGVYVSDECYKMATTDAISVACKQLGIGAYVYWQSGRSKYNASANVSDTLTDGEIQKLKNLCRQKGLSPNQVFNVPLEKLSKAQYEKARKQLETLKDKE